MTASIRHPHFTVELYPECLEIIRLCLFKESTNDSPYIDDEEERLIFVLEALMEKGLTESSINRWIELISKDLKEILENEGYSLSFFWKRTNVINFVRGLYFRLLYKNECIKLQESIVTILKQWHDQMYKTNL